MSPAPAAATMPASPEPQPWGTPTAELAESPDSAADPAEAQGSADAVRTLESSLAGGGSETAGSDVSTARTALAQPSATRERDVVTGPEGSHAAIRQLPGSDSLPCIVLSEPVEVPSPPVRPPASPTPSPKPRPQDSVSLSPTPFDERDTVSAEPGWSGSALKYLRDDGLHGEQVCFSGAQHAA